MAYRRMIDPNIWQSEDFGKLTPMAQLVFIGLFSNADDEGRGRGKAVYLKSLLFPYSENIKADDIKKAIAEIQNNMSIVFYEIDGNEYYQLKNWTNWQTIDEIRKKSSKIPPFESMHANDTQVARTSHDKCPQPANNMHANDTPKLNKTKLSKTKQIKTICTEPNASVRTEQEETVRKNANSQDIKNKGEVKMLNITKIEVQKQENTGKLKAYVNIHIESDFIIKGLKVLEGTDGLWIAMPSKKKQDGSFEDVCQPLNQETRKDLQEQILQAYNEQ